MKRLMNITVVDSNKITAIFHIRLVLDETVVFVSDSSIPLYLYKLELRCCMSSNEKTLYLSKNV